VVQRMSHALLVCNQTIGSREAWVSLTLVRTLAPKFLEQGSSCCCCEFQNIVSSKSICLEAACADAQKNCRHSCNISRNTTPDAVLYLDHSPGHVR
jgi:hypothetical protein